MTGAGQVGQTAFRKGFQRRNLFYNNFFTFAPGAAQAAAGAAATIDTD